MSLPSARRRQSRPIPQSALLLNGRFESGRRRFRDRAILPGQPEDTGRDFKNTLASAGDSIRAGGVLRPGGVAAGFFQEASALSPAMDLSTGVR